MSKCVLISSCALAALICPACSVGTKPPYPQPMLEKDDVKGFNYALTVFDVRQAAREHSPQIEMLQDGAMIEFLGPRAIDTSTDVDLVWDIIYAGEITVLAEGLDLGILRADTSRKGRTRITIAKKDMPAIENLEEEELRLHLYEGTDAAGLGKKLGTITVPISFIPAKISIDGPSVILTESEIDSYSWTVFHPGGPVVITIDGAASSPEAVSTTGAKTTVISLGRTDISETDAITINVYDGKDEQRAEPVFDREVPVGALKGRISGKFQIEDQLVAEKHFGSTFARTFFCVKVTIENTFDKPVRVHHGSITLEVRYVARMKKGQTTEDLEPFLVDMWYDVEDESLIKYGGDTYVIWTRDRMPMNFSDILNVFEFDQRHDPRNVFINLLRSAGIIASAAGTFGVGADYDKIVSFIQGPVTETLAEFLLADLIAHLGYLNDHALHDSTTVAPNEDVSKYVFFPRGDIIGVWGLELPVRVMTVRQGIDVKLHGTVQVKQVQTLSE